MTTLEDNLYLCSRCGIRDKEVIDGETQFYCDVCNDRLAEGYRERQEFNHYHSED